jgi:hypothetical protein
MLLAAAQRGLWPRIGRPTHRAVHNGLQLDNSRRLLSYKPTDNLSDHVSNRLGHAEEEGLTDDDLDQTNGG